MANVIDRTIIGKKLRILFMRDEPEYTGRTGIIRRIDDMGQIHGSWGGCAVIPGEDIYEIYDAE